MASVKLKNVYKRFEGGVIAVNDFNLDIEDKEFIILVGPSGCGKTTTLRMIAGLEEISDGEVYIGDRLVNDVQPKDRDIAMVFQNYALYPHMTVFDNMAFGLKLRKTPKADIKRRVHKAAKILDIEHILDRKQKEVDYAKERIDGVYKLIFTEASKTKVKEAIIKATSEASHLQGSDPTTYQRYFNNMNSYINLSYAEIDEYFKYVNGLELEFNPANIINSITGSFTGIGYGPGATYTGVLGPTGDLYPTGSLSSASGSLSAPTLTTPANNTVYVKGAQDIYVVFKWNAISNANSYIVEISTVSDFSTLDFTFNRDVMGYEIALSEIYVMFDGIKGKTYYWRVKSKNSTNESAWSAVNKVTIANS